MEERREPRGSRTGGPAPAGRCAWTWVGALVFMVVLGGRTEAGRPPPTSHHRDGRFYPVMSVQLLLGHLLGRGWHRGDEP